VTNKIFEKVEQNTEKQNPILNVQKREIFLVIVIKRLIYFYGGIFVKAESKSKRYLQKFIWIYERFRIKTNFNCVVAIL
jgi:hypothetical protein